MQFIAAWIERVNRELRDALNERWPKPMGSQVDPARSIHYEALRSGIDPNLVAALVMRFAKHGTSEAKAGSTALLPVNPEVIRTIKSEIASRAEALCVDTHAFRWNLRAALTVLRGHLDASAGDMQAALLGYAQRDIGLPYDVAQAFPDEILALWRRFEALVP